MEALIWATAAGAAVLVPPVRKRVLSVTEATIRTGAGLTAMAIAGAKDIGLAAARGESGRAPAPRRPTRTSRTRKTVAS
jgi:hypothetical protein